MADFIKLKKTGNKLILANGRPISIIKHSRKTEGLNHRGRIKGNDTIINVHGAFTGFESKLVDGESIKNSDKLLLVSAEGISTALDDFDAVKDGSKTWKIINVETISPADVIVLYKIHVRR